MKIGVTISLAHGQESWGTASGELELGAPPEVGAIIDMRQLFPSAIELGFPRALSVEGRFRIEADVEPVENIVLEMAVIPSNRSIQDVVESLESEYDMFCVSNVEALGEAER